MAKTIHLKLTLRLQGYLSYIELTTTEPIIIMILTAVLTIIVTYLHKSLETNLIKTHLKHARLHENKRDHVSMWFKNCCNFTHFG